MTVVALVASSCGGTTEPASTTEGSDVVPVGGALPVASRLAPSVDPTVAGKAVTAFGVDLFRAVRAEADQAANVIVSPASVATALAMLEPGASGASVDQFRTLLHIDDPTAYHASMNALEQSLESRVPQQFDSGDPGEVQVRIANAAYLQKGYPFVPSYLQAVGSNYGPVLREVDFLPDPDAVAHDINRWVAEATNDRITDLIADGVIRPDTVLALVNALYLKASWLGKFAPDRTGPATFTTAQGSEQQVQMMHGSSDSSARGDGWVGATKNYVGGLVAQFILPDDGRFEQVVGNISDVFDEYEQNRTSGADLRLPRFTLRYGAELSPPLQSLGLTAPYRSEGLMGVANDPRLIIDQVIHQTFVTMNEEGSEAAAATVALEYPVSLPSLEPVAVTLDRPFIFRISDVESGATLFIGEVLDPTG